MELGTAPFDDIDPEYGLHGYQLHIDLHNTESEFMSESFHSLFCHRGNPFVLESILSSTQTPSLRRGMPLMLINQLTQH